WNYGSRLCGEHSICQSYLANTGNDWFFMDLNSGWGIFDADITLTNYTNPCDDGTVQKSVFSNGGEGTLGVDPNPAYIFDQGFNFSVGQEMGYERFFYE